MASFLNNASIVQVFGTSTAPVQAELDGHLGPLGRSLIDGMTAEEALVLERGLRPRLLIRPSYLNDRMLNPLAKPNPFYRGRTLAEPLRNASPASGTNIIAFPRVRTR